MNKPIFITGIGTDVGKTIISAIITEALHADYWKPVQAGFENGTDALSVKKLITNSKTIIHPEAYCLQLPASPHIAARQEGLNIELDFLKNQATHIQQSTENTTLIVEGAGGLLVPLNNSLNVASLAKALNAKVILVSRNYLGSINHSLLTAHYCKTNDLEVLGWIFNDDYLQYENEIVQWSGIPAIASIPKLETIDSYTIHQEAQRIKQSLLLALS